MRNSRKAVFLIRLLDALGVVDAGQLHHDAVAVEPWRWITGSATPNALMRLSMVCSAWLTASRGSRLGFCRGHREDAAGRPAGCQLPARRGTRSASSARPRRARPAARRRPRRRSSPVRLGRERRSRPPPAACWTSRSMSLSVSARRASSVLTWSTRCMPPRRSRPRLIFSFGGKTAKTAAATTTARISSPRQSRLRVHVAHLSPLRSFEAGDRRLGDLAP